MSLEFVPTDHDLQALHDAHSAWNRDIVRFIEGVVQPKIEAVAAGRRSASLAISTLLMRVTSWLKSAEVPSEPEAFQAIATGVRSLFEIAVDLTLLHYDRTTYPLGKMLAWNESARLKSAVAAKRFMEETPKGQISGLTLATVEPMIEYVQRTESRIQELRRTFWPDRSNPKKGVHPPRWTGRPLDQDAKFADELSQRGFLEFYATRYSWVCWYIHGSVLAGVAAMTQSHFRQFVMFSLDDLGRFATQTAELALRFLDLWSADVEATFVERRRRQQETVAAIFNAHPARNAPLALPR